MSRPSSTAPIPTAWIPTLDAFTAAMRAGGAPRSTISTRVSHLRHLARRIGHPTPWSITGDDLVQWSGHQDWAAETRRSYRQSMLNFWRWAVEAGRTDTNPALALPRVPPATPKPRPASEIAYHHALTKADDRGRVMLRLAAECGLRRAEVAVVHQRDLVEDLVGWSLVVHGKGDKDRIVPLPNSLAAELRRAPRGYMFPGNDNGHLSPRWVGKIVTTLLPGSTTMHQLRHRFASRAYQHDRDVFAVQELLGHASPATTRIYVAVPNESLRATVEAVQRAA